MIGENYKKTPKDVMIEKLISAETIADEGTNSLFDLIVKEIDSWLMKDGCPESDRVQEWLKRKMFAKNVNIYYNFEKGSLTTEPVPDGTYLLGKEYLNKMKNCKLFLESFSSELKDIGGGVHRLNFKVDELKLKDFIKSRMVTLAKTVAKKIILLSGEELAPKEFSESLEGVTSLQLLSESELLRYLASIFFEQGTCKVTEISWNLTVSQFFDRVENGRFLSYQKYLPVYNKLLDIFEEGVVFKTESFDFDYFTVNSECKQLLLEPKSNYALYLYNYLSSPIFKRLINKAIGYLFENTNSRDVSYIKLSKALKRICEYLNPSIVDEKYQKLILENAFQPFEYKNYNGQFLTSLAECCQREILQIEEELLEKEIKFETPTIDFQFIKEVGSKGFHPLQNESVSYNEYHHGYHSFRFLNDTTLFVEDNNNFFEFIKSFDKINLNLDIPVDLFVNERSLTGNFVKKRFPSLLKLIQKRVYNLYVKEEQIGQYQLAVQMLKAGLMNTFVCETYIEQSINLLETILEKSSQTKEDS